MLSRPNFAIIATLLPASFAGSVASLLLDLVVHWPLGQQGEQWGVLEHKHSDLPISGGPERNFPFCRFRSQYFRQ